MTLQVQGLWVSVRRTPVVQDVSLALGSGEAVGLVGRSGAGKTLTALAILGLLPPAATVTAGSVRIRDAELLGMTERQLADVRGRRVSMVFQDPYSSLNPSIRVGDQVAEVFERHLGSDRSEARRRALEILDLVGIPAARYSDYPHTFSGGMRQRVMIAMALGCGPDVLIADEPTTALDVLVQKEILRLLVAVQDEFGMGMLLVSHDLAVVAETCHRVAVMHDGRIVEQGPVGAVFAGQAHPHTAELLASSDA
jgi:peptide/nickel transport system ATP-binding protein